MELPPMGELRARDFCHHIPNGVVLVAAPGRVGSWSVRRAVRRLKHAEANLVASCLTD
jgi:Mrp family chromosome partitioning ATPase